MCRKDKIDDVREKPSDEWMPIMLCLKLFQEEGKKKRQFLVGKVLTNLSLLNLPAMLLPFMN